MRFFHLHCLPKYYTVVFPDFKTFTNAIILSFFFYFICTTMFLRIAVLDIGSVSFVFFAILFSII